MLLAQVTEVLDPVLQSASGRNDIIYLSVIVICFCGAVLMLFVYLGHKHIPSIIDNNSQRMAELSTTFVNQMMAESDKHDKQIERMDEESREFHREIMKEAKATAEIYAKSMENVTESNRTMTHTLENVVQVLREHKLIPRNHRDAAEGSS